MIDLSIPHPVLRRTLEGKLIIVYSACKKVLLENTGESIADVIRAQQPFEEHLRVRHACGFV
jgi:hypothetical protein